MVTYMGRVGRVTQGREPLTFKCAGEHLCSSLCKVAIALVKVFDTAGII